jgi:DNA-binding LacI/PurR family transcriptional regulator
MRRQRDLRYSLTDFCYNLQRLYQRRRWMMAEARRRRARAVTTQDVAHAAAVSRVTVSRVLNNHGNVTDRVRQRVLQAAADVGYLSRPPREAPVAVLRDIGFFFASILGDEPLSDNPFWTPVLHGVEQEASAAGIHVTYRSITPYADRPGALLDLVRSASLDGILVVGPASEPVVRALHDAEVPLVLVDNAVPGVPADAVLGDCFGGGRAAVRHLVGLGHRDIAFIGGPFVESARPLGHRTNTIWSVEQRALGYLTALKEAGIEPDYRLYEGCNLTTAGGYAACQRLLATGRRFTGIFCANDVCAIGVIRAMHEAGLTVPRDVSVVGFDDIEVARHLIPPLTTVRVDKEAIGAWAIQRLLARALAPSAISSTTCLHVELVERGTAAQPAA